MQNRPQQEQNSEPTTGESVPAHPTGRLPALLGRVDGTPNDESYVRAGTRPLTSVGLPFEGAAIGFTTVSAFESESSEDCGGLVLRVTTENLGSAFKPVAINIPDGAEIHIAGDEEARAFITALRQMITQVDILLQHRERVRARRSRFSP